jgi:hypothetical protein
MKFDSKVVIPTQFVLFNLTAIVGSAVLYRDFDKFPFERLVIFLYGCAATFIGVFILARTSPSAVDDDEASTVQGDRPDTQSESGTSPTAHRASIHYRGSFSFSPAQNHPNLLFPGTTPLTAGPSAGSVRATVRPRASSSTIMLSPAKYLLLATEPITPSGSAPVPILGVPIARQQSTPTPQRRESSQAVSSRMIPSRISSRSQSRDGGVESARVGESHNSRT